MMKQWFEKLQEEHVKEFSFFPNAYTPLKEDKSIALPDIELEFGDGEEKEESAEGSSTPEWVKNVSFTIAGVTIGGAAVYSFFATTPPPACPAPVSTTQQAVQSPLPSSSAQNPNSTNSSSGSAGGAPRTTGTSPANSTATTTANAGTAPGSAGGSSATSSGIR